MSHDRKSMSLLKAGLSFSANWVIAGIVIFCLFAIFTPAFIAAKNRPGVYATWCKATGVTNLTYNEWCDLKEAGCLPK